MVKMINKGRRLWFPLKKDPDGPESKTEPAKKGARRSLAIQENREPVSKTPAEATRDWVLQAHGLSPGPSPRPRPPLGPWSTWLQKNREQRQLLLKNKKAATREAAEKRAAANLAAAKAAARRPPPVKCKMAKDGKKKEKEKEEVSLNLFR